MGRHVRHARAVMHIGIANPRGGKFYVSGKAHNVFANSTTGKLLGNRSVMRLTKTSHSSHMSICLCQHFGEYLRYVSDTVLYQRQLMMSRLVAV